MNSLARVTQEALAAPIPDKHKPIPRKVRHALDLMFRGECRDIKAAAAQAKMSREHLSRSLRMPHVQAFIARKSRETVALGQIQASNRIVELVHAGSEHVSLDASKHILAIEGIRPPETGTNINIVNNVAPGYVIDLREPAGKTVEHVHDGVAERPATISTTYTENSDHGS